MPSASVAIVKFYKDKLEYFLLGDCTIIINDMNKNIVLKDERVCKFDNIIFENEKMKNLNEDEKLTVKDRKDKLSYESTRYKDLTKSMVKKLKKKF
ncbi:hypothetical protein [Terrisporobacter sp.]